MAVLAAPAAARDGPDAGPPVPVPQAPVPQAPVPQPRPDGMTFDTDRLCDLIERAAGLNHIPPAFFARLIWKESRFDIRALSPKGAEGVAQFMPRTARLRGLADPWDPRQAIPASARLLAELRDRFGNLGLAAAAYDGGADRVASWLADGGGLPWETSAYVRAITGRDADWFREPGREVEARPLEDGFDFDEACRRLPVMATRADALATSAPWGVQIAAGISTGAAARAFRRAQARLDAVVGDEPPILVHSRLVGGRRLWSGRVGAESRAEAERLCDRIRRAGEPCVVRRN